MRSTTKSERERSLKPGDSLKPVPTRPATGARPRFFQWSDGFFSVEVLRGREGRASSRRRHTTVQRCRSFLRKRRKLRWVGIVVEAVESNPRKTRFPQQYVGVLLRCNRKPVGTIVGIMGRRLGKIFYTSPNSFLVAPDLVAKRRWWACTSRNR